MAVASLSSGLLRHGTEVSTVSEHGNSVTHTETTVTAGNKLFINSGGDTTLKGAQASGKSIVADVGGNLTITSEQDGDRYDSGQQSASAGGSYTFGAGGASGSVSASRDKIHSSYESVREQSGLFAGEGGFNVNVGKHTQLDGGVISSAAMADKNGLTTGTLGWNDIQNKADVKSQHQGAGLSSGGSIGGQFSGNMENALLAGVNHADGAQGTTKAAVSEGSIVIRDRDAQKQDVSELSRDTENANGSIAPIFNKEKEQRRLAQAQLIGEIGSQAADIARTQGEINGLRAESDPAKLAEARAELEAKGKPFSESDVMKQAHSNAQAQWGTGSAIQQGIQAATAAVQGLAGGNMAQAIAGSSAPYLAEQIHRLTQGNPQAQAVAHAVLGAVTSWAAGNGALAGAAGGVSGELMAQLVMKQLYPGKTVGELTEEQKQTVSTLGTLAAGLAGGIAGGSTADAVAGAQAGKNAVENNALSASDEKRRQDAKWSLPYLEGEKKKQAEKLISDLNAKDKAFDAMLNAACQGLSSAACQGMRQELASMAKSYDEQLDGQYIGNMGSVYKDGKGQVDALLWQYASSDAKAEREANVNRIAENWGVSKETAANLYDGMASVHTTAAIGGAVYGMKGVKEPATSPATPAKHESSGKGGSQTETKPASGAENAATYPKLKDDLVQQNLNNIAKQDPRLAAVVQGDNGKLNYGVGSGSASEADRLGKIWVGDGAKLVGNQKDCPGCLISADGLRIYRPPSAKPNAPTHLNPTGTQANFVQQKDGKITGNAHMSIKK